MITRCRPKRTATATPPPITLLLLFVIQMATLGARSSSISSNKQDNNQQVSQQQLQQQHQAPQQVSSTTSLPGLLTTMMQTMESANYVKSGRDQVQHASEGPKQRSSNEEHDDTVPLATINNHSRNNQAQLRPPQYVDVSALVGVSRGRN